jgi:hypothetical protein
MGRPFGPRQPGLKKHWKNESNGPVIVLKPDGTIKKILADSAAESRYKYAVKKQRQRNNTPSVLTTPSRRADRPGMSNKTRSNG